ncbi:10235_t:CDS:2, partial [Entrophospora sp. SA101]
GWHPVNEQPLMKKSRGRSLHVSDFVTETVGWLRLSEEQKLEWIQMAMQRELELF